MTTIPSIKNVTLNSFVLSLKHCCLYGSFFSPNFVHCIVSVGSRVSEPTWKNLGALDKNKWQHVKTELQSICKISGVCIFPSRVPQPIYKIEKLSTHSTLQTFKKTWALLQQCDPCLWKNIFWSVSLNTTRSTGYIKEHTMLQFVLWEVLWVSSANSCLWMTGVVRP